MPEQAPTMDAAMNSRPWWESRPFVAAMILLAAVPLIHPPIPPLVDLLGHMGRYRVQLDVANSPWLQQYYGFRWAPIGNLGVDLLIIPMGKIFGLELGVKLIVMAIPMMTAAGFLWVAREVHGRLPPTVLFALPFVYCHPFMFGFINYTLSIALAFLAFGLWLRLARLGLFKLRSILFVPISIVVFFAHVFGWGVLGLLCFSAEAVRQHDAGKPWLRAGLNAALQASVMALPLLIMLAWRNETQGSLIGPLFAFKMKTNWILLALRDRWQWFDIGSLALAVIVIIGARISREFEFSRNLAFSAIVLLVFFAILPYVIFGSAYADMRLFPYVIAVALLAIRFHDRTHRDTERTLAVIGLAFFLMRLAGNTISLADAADDQSAKLQAIEHVPMGARVATLVGEGCNKGWALPRNSHLGALVIVRRHGFSNDQWVTDGVNLLQLHYREAGRFSADPSQIVRKRHCQRRTYWTIDRALQAIPRDKFDYIWLIGTESSDPRLKAGLTPVWRSHDSTLYRLPPAS